MKIISGKEKDSEERKEGAGYTEGHRAPGNMFHLRGNMANMFKAYGSEVYKYSGSSTDNFERRFMLFLELCEQADISKEDRHRTFSIVLGGSARQYYFDFFKSKKLDLKAVEEEVKSRFQTQERTHALLRE